RGESTSPNSCEKRKGGKKGKGVEPTFQRRRHRDESATDFHIQGGPAHGRSPDCRLKPASSDVAEDGRRLDHRPEFGRPGECDEPVAPKRRRRVDRLGRT